MDLRRVDLNLLLVFNSLMETCSATKTAEILLRTQPGVSRDLARLRTCMGDPLFVKVRSRLEPTPYAKRLLPYVRQALDSIEQGLMLNHNFDPSVVSHVAHVGTSSALELLLANRMYSNFSLRAPGIVLRFSNVHGEYLPVEDLEEDKLHVAIGRFPNSPPHIRSQHLFSDKRVCIVRKGHPIASRRLTVQQIAKMKFVTTANMLERENELDRLLRSAGLRRAFPVLTSSLMVAPLLILDSDVATTLPERVAEFLAERYPLKIIALPRDLPASNYSMVWHQRWDTSPAHCWVREQIKSIFLAPM
jgi:DNA-binding transcriptional LysR family regulator